MEKTRRIGVVLALFWGGAAHAQCTLESRLTFSLVGAKPGRAVFSRKVTAFYQGDRMAQYTGEGTDRMASIYDCGKGTLTQVNWAKKTYSVVGLREYYEARHQDNEQKKIVADSKDGGEKQIGGLRARLVLTTIRSAEWTMTAEQYLVNEALPCAEEVHRFEASQSTFNRWAKESVQIEQILNPTRMAVKVDLRQEFNANAPKNLRGETLTSTVELLNYSTNPIASETFEIPNGFKQENNSVLKAPKRSQ